MHKETQDCTHKIKQELLVIEEALRMSMRCLEPANAYDELERQFCLANPIPLCPCHKTIVHGWTRLELTVVLDVEYEIVC